MNWNPIVDDNIAPFEILEEAKYVDAPAPELVEDGRVDTLRKQVGNLGVDSVTLLDIN
jgi:hypothetical protein